MSKIVIVGAGLGGLAGACLLANHGHEVTILEKNERVGGRAGMFEAEGFRFDTGPSWYLMPEIIENFFMQIGEDIRTHLNLVRLQPNYRVTFKDRDQQIDIHGDLKRDAATFEDIERGAGDRLRTYVKDAEQLYAVAAKHFLYKSYNHKRSALSPALTYFMWHPRLLGSLRRHVRRSFTDPRLQHILEYPAMFLGASPSRTPALYSMLNHVDFNQGVWYPQGGIYELVKALERMAVKRGVRIILNAPVTKIITGNGQATGVRAGDTTYPADVIISNAGAQHTELKLLDPIDRDHSPKYWQRQRLAPSALLMYLGTNRRYNSLLHHNLLFSQNWQKHFSQVFDAPALPDDPSLYICAPSRTDASVAPAGHENIFVLVPLAAGLSYTDKQLAVYADKILATMESQLDMPDLRQHLVYKKLFCVKDFAQRFNSPSGTALGIGHTLRQTAWWRPANRSKKVSNLYFVGADVHPGIGMPSCLISASLVAQQLGEVPQSARDRRA